MVHLLATPAYAGPAHPGAVSLANGGNPVSMAAESVSTSLNAFPPLLVALILVVGAVVVAIILSRIIVHAFPRRLRERHPTLDTIINRGRPILLAGLVIILLGSVIPAMPIAGSLVLTLLLVPTAAFILVLGWAAILVIDVLCEHQISLHRDNIQADVMARRQATNWQVLRRISRVVIVLLAVAAALMVFPAVRQYGLSLLASAGAAGLVLGFAARPVLSNLIAGIQLAITQPLRIEDAVIINEQWGWIEEITATYIVVRIWNWQRMVVPLAWLLEQPFQNWTRESSELIGSVHLNVDYTVPLEALRKELDAIVHSTPLWNGKVVVLQVVEALPATIQLRALVSAKDSGEAWDLRCYVREKLIVFLQQHYPEALPRQRIEVDGQMPSERHQENRGAFASAG